jgi:transposase InsO family protein
VLTLERVCNTVGYPKTIRIGQGGRDYNEARPHSAIGNKAPISLLNGSSAPPPA